MKKYILLTLALFALTVGSAMAATVAADANPTDGGGTLAATTPATGDIAKMSKGVKLTANYDNAGYALITKHNNGPKQFGTADDSTAIYSEELASVSTVLDVPAAANGTEFLSTPWTAQ